jgi:hypothetical protein
MGYVRSELFKSYKTTPLIRIIEKVKISFTYSIHVVYFRFKRRIYIYRNPRGCRQSKSPENFPFLMQIVFK